MARKDVLGLGMPEDTPLGLPATPSKKTSATNPDESTQNTTTTNTPTTKALQYGATGDDVKSLQTTLNSFGYGLDVDGSFGPATLAAVKDYQSKNNLDVDGSVGPLTSASLAANSAAQTTQTPAAQTPAAEAPVAAQPSSSGSALADAWKANIPQVDTQAMANQWKADIPDVKTSKSDLKNLLDQWKSTVVEQNEGKIDFAVAQAVSDLERALEDAQPQFKEQQESIAKDEMQARDNSALYAEARGDKGGIGQEQYNSIMNTAAQNRLVVQQAQTKLSTDTQRQIADLRAQGEFDKADAALEISQQYLSQLMSLEQWALDYGLSTAQFKASLDQWAADYELAMAEYKNSLDRWAVEFDTGNRQWQQNFDYQKEQDTKNNLAGIAEALLSAGIPLSDEQMRALNISKTQADAYISKVESSGGSISGGGEDTTNALYQLVANNVPLDVAEGWLVGAGWDPDEARAIAKAYKTGLETGLFGTAADLTKDDETAKNMSPYDLKSKDALGIYGIMRAGGFDRGDLYSRMLDADMTDEEFEYLLHLLDQYYL